MTYLPYLPLRERGTVGEWELIPRADIVEADATDARVYELALGLADLYELPSGAWVRLGLSVALGTAWLVTNRPP